MNRPVLKALLLIFSMLLAACQTNPETQSTPISHKERLEVINQVLESHRPDVAHCYRVSNDEKKLGENKLSLIFVIAASGNTKSIRIDELKTTVADSALIDCVTSLSKTWNFPKAIDEKDLKIKFVVEFYPR